MGLLDKVLGKQDGKAGVSETDESNRAEAPAEVAEIAAEPMDEGQVEIEPEGGLEGQQSPMAAGVPDGVRAFDQDGREVIVPREEWRTNVLPGMIKEAWDQPEQLYILLLNSLNDGFLGEMEEAARHLYETDTVLARGACMWGVVLLQMGRLDEAERVLEGFLATNGEEASVMTNLAKVLAAKGYAERAETTLWRALELDPNLDNGLGWYVSTEQQRGGDEAAKAALERIRALPGSWRAQLWLARAETNASNLHHAKALYTEALERAPKPIPGDLLMQMTGDLGTHGLLRELLEFSAPHFVPELHGLPVGNNLIKACLDTGNIDPAEMIVRDLARFNRPDWKAPLDFWAGEIVRRRGSDPAAQQLQIGMLRVDGPIWLPGSSPARRLFGTKQTPGPSVTFLGGTAEAPQDEGAVTPVMADALGRMTRALPLFLAEQVDLLGAATGRAMVPWAVSQGPGTPSGFVVSGQRWPDEVAVQSVSGEPNQSDYVVSVHVDGEVEPWTADLAFVRSKDGVRIGELTREFDPAQPEDGIRTLATEVLELLGEAGLTGGSVAYKVPEGHAFTSYLTRLEQLLAVRCAGMDGVSPEFLNGEAAILDGELALCQAQPDNAAARLLLVETLAGMRVQRPAVVEEFMPRLQELEETAPLPVIAAAFA